jgi:pSer/pThr/pTyr-binding forkhead associated (FHA) protein
VAVNVTANALLPTTGLALRDLAEDARVLDLAAFQARYASAFFIRHGSLKNTPHAPMRTRSDNPAHAAARDDAARPDDDGSENTGEIVIVALPLRRQATSEHPFIGIGRLEGCDIAIFDETVSKFHAYVKEQPAGTWLLQDAKSRNGTTVEGNPVAQRGAGPPTVLSFGQVVRFGSVTTTFVDAASVITLASRLTRA